MIFQFRDPTPIEAFVLASDYDRANEMFAQHLRAHGGDPDTLMWRQPGLEHLEEDERAAVEEALALNREGLLTCDAQGRWSFLAPLGVQSEAPAGEG